jgi:rubrerythrin
MKRPELSGFVTRPQRARKRETASAIWSRRSVLQIGAATGIIGAFSTATLSDRVAAMPSMNPSMNQREDAKILNNALFYEYQAIWAYNVAAGKLTNTSVGQAVAAIALANQADHKRHAQKLDMVIQSLGATPIQPAATYDLSAYLQAREGGLDSDVNIAKLALALETDAAIAYSKEIATLKTPALITAGASIGATEATHAAIIRAAFKSLGVDLAIVPAAFVSSETRDAWILKV